MPRNTHLPWLFSTSLSPSLLIRMRARVCLCGCFACALRNAEFVRSGRYGEVVDLRGARLGDSSATVAAMARGAAVIFQAPLALPTRMPAIRGAARAAAGGSGGESSSSSSGGGGGSVCRSTGSGVRGFAGVADFLVRVDHTDHADHALFADSIRADCASGGGGNGGGTNGGVGGGVGVGGGAAPVAGSYHYEVWDAKLAKRAKPSHVMQLCAYQEMVAALETMLEAKLELSAARPSTKAELSSSAPSSAPALSTSLFPCSSSSSSPPPRAVLVLDGATAPTRIDLAPYQSFYRSLKQR